MASRWETLKKEIIRLDNYDGKKKLVKAIRREIADKIENIKINAISVGYDDRGQREVVALIDCDFSNAILIKEALIGNTITKYFSIRFAENETYPKDAKI